MQEISGAKHPAQVPGDAESPANGKPGPATEKAVEHSYRRPEELTGMGRGLVWRLHEKSTGYQRPGHLENSQCFKPIISDETEVTQTGQNAKPGKSK